MKKNIRLCLIDIKIPYTPTNTPLNLLSLASYLIDHRVLRPEQITIINSNSTHSIERVVRLRPDVIGLSVVSPAYPYAAALAKLLKRKTRAAIVIGGHHITGAPEYLRYPFDAGIAGEGEGALADIVCIIKEGKELSEETMRTIPNVIYRNSTKQIVQNPMRPLLRPDELPKYHWELLAPEEIVKYETVFINGTSKLVRRVQIFSARGCPYQCVFCARQIIWKTGLGFRYVPLPQIMKEIEYLYQRYHISALDILDDTFAVSKQRVREFVREFEKRGWLGKIVLPWVFVRANLIDEEFVSLLKQLGVLTVLIGIESGSPRILRYLKNGSLRVPHVKNAVRLFAKQGIRVLGSFMLFVPGETVRDLDKTYALAQWFARQNNAHALGIYITTPYPGTKLWDDFVVHKHVDIQSIQWHHFRHFISHQSGSIGKKVFFRNGFSTRQLDAYWKRMYVLQSYVANRTKTLPGWKIAQQEEERKNAQAIYWLEMKWRLGGILHDPKRIISKASDPRIWQKVFHDMRMILHG